MKLFTLNKAAKAYYFGYSAACVPLIPFVPVIAKAIGLSTVAIGTMLTISTLLSIVMKPIFGSLADKLLMHKTIVMITIAIDMVSSFNIQFFPPAGVDRTVLFECSSSPRVLIKSNSALLNSQDAMTAINNSAFSCQLDLETQSLDGYYSLPNDYKTPDNGQLSIHTTLRYDSVQMMNTLVMNVDSSNTTTCYEPKNVTGLLYCSNGLLNSIVSKPVTQEVASRSLLFWMFPVNIIIGAVGSNIAMSVGDSICLKQLEDATVSFADIKLFGSISWGIFGLLGGTIADWYSQGKDATDYTLNCYISGISHILTLISVYCMKSNFVEKPKSIYADVRSIILRDPRFIIFLVVAIFSGSCMGLLSNYINWYIEYVAEESGSNTSVKSLEGIVIFVQTVGGEIPFLLLSGYIINCLGHIHCFSLVLLTYGIRFTYYYVLTNPWWIIPIEILHGLTNAFFKVAVATYAFELALPGTEATILGIASAAVEGVGYSLGAFIGGVIIDALGARFCFLLMGICAFVAAFFNTVLHCFLPQMLKSTNVREEAEE